MIQTALRTRDVRLTTVDYFGLVRTGHLHEEDRVELLEGVLVAMSPQNPPHAAALRRSESALRKALGPDAAISTQCPLVLGEHSVPEPDVAVLPGRNEDYDRAHPTTALLVVEVPDSSLAQDRITKMRIYAAADIPELWVLNLRDDCVEVFRAPDATARRYRTTEVRMRGGRLSLVKFPQATVAVSELLPNLR